MRIFPKSPLTLLFGQLGDLCQVSSDTGTPGPHAGEMRGVVAAHASDAAIGPGRVELNALDIVDDGFDALLGRMLDSAFSIFDSCFAQRNETLQSRWDFFVGVRLRIGPAALVAQIVRQRVVQVNNFVILPCTDAALWTKKNDLHRFSSFTSFSSLRAFEQFKSFQPFATINVVQSSLNLLFSPYESRTSFLSFRKLVFQPSPF